MQWSGTKYFRIQLAIVWLISLLGCAVALDDPYKILGIGRKSSITDIRKAYRQLAKEWHPDKSQDPEAGNKFVEIKQAYELLSDPERRRAYDYHGITEDTTNFNTKYDYSNYARFSDNIDDIFGNFQFQEQDITFFHKLSVTTRHFDLYLVPNSARTPHLLFFYTDWCFSCIKAVPVWRRVVEHLEPLGVHVATVQASHEATLTRRLSVPSLPSVVLLIDGVTYVYKDSVFNTQKVVEFIKQKLPYKLVVSVSDNNVDRFLSGWDDNRIRGLIFEPKASIRLRYQLMAFHYKHRVVFGFVDMTAKNTQELVKRFNVASNLDTLIVLDEDPTKPRASVAMKEIPVSTLHNIISNNQYLMLPRLSSQGILDAVCPPEWSRPRKRLCAVLITRASEEHNAARKALRLYARHAPWSAERVRFTYIYQETQSEFIDSLKKGENCPPEPLLHIVIIWRRDTTRVQYEWVSGEWLENDDVSVATMTPEQDGRFKMVNDTRQKLKDTIQRLLKTNEALSYETVIANDLLDEHAQSWITRIIEGVLLKLEQIYDGIEQEHFLAVLTVLCTFALVITIGYIVSYLLRQEDESIREKNKLNGNNNNNNVNKKNAAAAVPELRLHELRAEKYNGLVRLLKPGCRTIILLVDAQSRLQLIPEFHRIVWPYRKNKTLMFGHMLLERGVSWYKELLEQALPEYKDLNINPRNCVGTVLSLNGHRKYFCMYHAKHPENGHDNQRLKRITKRMTKRRNDDPEAGVAFLGFEDSDSSDNDSPLLQGTLLEGMPNWLDRLFEGTTQRYYINYWPDFPTK